MKLLSHQKKIILISVLVIISIIFLGVRFHRKTPQPVTLQIWSITNEEDVFLPIISSFQKRYPYIQLNYIAKQGSDYRNELLNAFAEDKAPDIFMVKNSWIPYYENINRIYALDLGKDEDLNLFDLEQNYAQIAREEILKGNKLFGIPLYIDTLALYYNKDVFNYYNIALAPSTWEELLDTIPRLRRINKQGQITRAAIALGSPYNVNWNFDIISVLTMQYGSNMVDKAEKEATFYHWIDHNGKEIIPAEESLKFYTQFVNPYSPYYTWNDNFRDSVEAFSKGETVMMIGYNQDQKIIKKYNPNLNYGIASLPQFTDSSKVNYGNAVSFVVSKESEHPRECWQFLKFLAQKNVAEFYYLQTKNPPARLDLIQKYINEPGAGIFIRQILTSKNWYQYDFWEITKIFQEMIEDVTYKGKSPKEAVITASNKIKVFWAKK